MTHICMRASQQFGNSGQYFSQCINGRSSMCPYPDRKSLGYSCHAHLHIRVRILQPEIKGTTFNKPFYPDLARYGVEKTTTEVCRVFPLLPNCKDAPIS